MATMCEVLILTELLNECLVSGRSERSDGVLMGSPKGNQIYYAETKEHEKGSHYGP